MKSPGHISPWLVLCLVATVLPACGNSSPVLTIEFQEDTSRPCLGAALQRVRVLDAESTAKTMDAFGFHFQHDDLRCAFASLVISDLVQARPIRLEIQLWDSTADESGLIATATTVSFESRADSPDRVLYLDLARRAQVQQGTLLLGRPPDWADWPQIQSLEIRIMQADREVRSARSSFSRSRDADPFPLIVTGLPVADAFEESRVLVTGLDAQQNRRVSWAGSGWMDGARPLGEAPLAAGESP